MIILLTIAGALIVLMIAAASWWNGYEAGAKDGGDQARRERLETESDDISSVRWTPADHTS